MSARARERFRRLAHHERRARHRFDAAGDGEVDLAGADRARGVADRIEAGGAEPVHGDAGHMIRQAREQRRHARDIAVVLAGLVGAAEHDLVERGPVDVRIALDQRPDRDRGQIVGAHLGERAAVAADRRADRIAQEDVAHCDVLTLTFLMIESVQQARSAPSPQWGERVG